MLCRRIQMSRLLENHDKYRLCWEFIISAKTPDEL